MKARRFNGRLLVGVVVLLATTLAVRSAPFRLLRIASGSMMPALSVGDRVVVSMDAFSNDDHRPTNLPRRGAVVAFVAPSEMVEAARHDVTSLVGKRIVGIPGDTLVMRDGKLFLNGVAEQRDVILAGRAYQRAVSPESFAWQHPFEVAGTRFGVAPEKPSLENWGPLVVPAGQYFMLGDNRFCSIDSRHWGFLPRDNIKGEVLFSYWSMLPTLSGSYDPCNGETREGFRVIRWSHLGRLVK
jgi:signal peptidase I